MSNTSERPYKFGTFELDPVRVELRRDGEHIALRPKCFDLLLYFLQNPVRLITKEELLEQIWNGVVVNEGTITRTVTALRSALDDEADHPMYIETVQRRGYKFIAAVDTPEVRQPAAESADFALIHNKREFPLRDGEHLIGRGRDVAVPLYGSAISRHHARIIVSGATVTLEDLGSRNGTYVNGTRVIGSVALESGDEVSIGDDRLVLWSRGGETASAPVR